MKKYEVFKYKIWSLGTAFGPAENCTGSSGDWILVVLYLCHIAVYLPRYYLFVYKYFELFVKGDLLGNHSFPGKNTVRNELCSAGGEVKQNLGSR